MPTREKPAESFPINLSPPNVAPSGKAPNTARRADPFDAGANGTYRPLGHFILVALFALLAANAWNEALDIARRVTDEPMGLFWLQLGAGALAVASGIGVWRQAKWATFAIAAWGIESAAMIVLLGPLLKLDPAATVGLWAGAAIVLGMAAGSVLYLRRSLSKGRSSHGRSM